MGSIFFTPLQSRRARKERQAPPSPNETLEGAFSLSEWNPAFSLANSLLTLGLGRKKGTVGQKLPSTFGLPSSMSLISIFHPDPVDAFFIFLRPSSPLG